MTRLIQPLIGRAPRESLGSHCQWATCHTNSTAAVRLQPNARLLLLDFTARLITGVEKKKTEDGGEQSHTNSRAPWTSVVRRST